MKTLFTFTLLVSYILLFSCKDENRHGPSLTTISVTQQNANMDGNLDRIISKIVFVPLQTNDSSLIKEISKLVVIGDTVLIGDFTLGKLFLFNKSGSFISSFSHLGKGPGEYTMIQDFTYDEKAKNILLMDAGSRKFLKYQLNGSFVGDMKANIPNIGQFFESFNDKLIFYRHNLVFPEHANHNIVITNEDQEYISSGATIPEQIENLPFFGNKCICKDDSVVYVFPCYSDTIFSISSQNTIIPKYHISIDRQLDIKQSKHWEQKYNNILQLNDKIIKNGYIYQICDFYMLPNHVLFRYFSGKGCSLVRYSINEGITNIYNNPTITNSNFLFNPIGKDGDNIILQITPTSDINKLNQYLKDPVGLNSNPVLCFIKFNT